jgi:hypothetical protein
MQPILWARDARAKAEEALRKTEDATVAVINERFNKMKEWAER